jgi:protein-disulfide isomerase
VFGDRCLKQWLQDSDSCPYCRDKLPSEPKRSQREEEVRRMIAHARAYGLDHWTLSEASRMHAESAMPLEQQHQYLQEMHRQLRQGQGGADEVLAR